MTKRKQKVYVDSKDAAVELAKSVAGSAEEKVHAKVKMQHQKASARTDPQQQHGRASSSKERLERAKAVVAAQAARAKREKAKQRKKARAPPDQNVQGPGTHLATTGGKTGTDSDGRPKKRVAFN